GDLRTRIALRNEVADGMHQVRLAEPHAAVDEQRVVRAARVLADLHGGRARELIALAFDEAFERERSVQAAAERRARRPRLALRADRLAPEARARARADFDDDVTAAAAVRAPPRADVV